MRTAASLAISIAAEASEICDDTAAVSRPPSTRVRSERILSRFGLARAFVVGDAGERHDLAVEAAFVAGAQGALGATRPRTPPSPRARCPTSRRSSPRRGTATPPGCRTRASQPGEPDEGCLEAVLLADEHRRADRDRATCSARRPRRRGRRCPTSRPARRSGPPAATSRTADRRLCPGPRRGDPRRASTCARCRPPADRSCRRSRRSRPRPRPGRRRRGPSARGSSAHRGRPGGSWASPPLRRPTGLRTASTM